MGNDQPTRRRPGKRVATLVYKNALTQIAFAILLLLPQMTFAHGETLIQIRALTQQIEGTTNPSAQLFVQRGNLYREHEDWISAEADFARAASLEPELATIDFSRAGMLADSGQLKAAQEMYNKVLARTPKYGEAFIGRARVLARLNQHSAAVPDFQRGLELLTHPEPEFYLELAQCLMTERKVPEALQNLDAGIRKFGPIVPLQSYAVDLELARNNTDGAIQRLDTIIELIERKEKWFSQRGDILLTAGREEEARKSYRAALTAIDALPPRLRQSPSMMELQTHIHTTLREIAPRAHPDAEMPRPLSAP